MFPHRQANLLDLPLAAPRRAAPLAVDALYSGRPASRQEADNTLGLNILSTQSVIGSFHAATHSSLARRFPSAI